MRILASFLTGALFSLMGSVLQGLTQNDLSCPSTLGLYAYVLIWPLLSIFFLPVGWNLGFFSLTIFFMGWLFCIPLLKYFLKDQLGHVNKEFILVGICINLFLGSVMALMHFCMMALNKPFPQYLWYGDFRFVQPSSIMMLGIVAILFYAHSFFYASHFQLLCFGHHICHVFHVNVKKISTNSLILVILALGVITCFFGMFSFVALLFPHLLRTLNVFKYRLDREIKYGPFINGGIFSLVDLGVYNLNPWGVEFPIGLIFSTLGPMVLMGVLLARHNKSLTFSQ